MATVQVSRMTEGQRHIATIQSREQLLGEVVSTYDVTCERIYGEGNLKFAYGALGRALNAACASEDFEATRYVLDFADNNPWVFNWALEEARTQQLVRNIN